MSVTVNEDNTVTVALPDGGLPQAVREGDGWTVDRVKTNDGLTDDLLLAGIHRDLAVLAARAAARPPVDPLPELAGLGVGSVAVCRHLMGDDRAWVGTYVQTAPGTWTPMRHCAEEGPAQSGWEVIYRAPREADASAPEPPALPERGDPIEEDRCISSADGHFSGATVVHFGSPVSANCWRVASTGLWRTIGRMWDEPWGRAAEHTYRSGPVLADWERDLLRAHASE